MSWVQAHLGFSSRYGVLGCGGSSFVGATYIEFVGPELFMICGNTFQYFVYHIIEKTVMCLLIFVATHFTNLDMRVSGLEVMIEVDMNTSESFCVNTPCPLFIVICVFPKPSFCPCPFIEKIVSCDLC